MILEKIAKTIKRIKDIELSVKYFVIPLIIGIFVQPLIVDAFCTHFRKSTQNKFMFRIEKKDGSIDVFRQQKIHILNKDTYESDENGYITMEGESSTTFFNLIKCEKCNTVDTFTYIINNPDDTLEYSGKFPADLTIDNIATPFIITLYEN
ncbi:MAG: hypothetical protein F9K23_15600 [Bacteroidetes bacterium]|nr:MAG: hypothetical protein F9K23_15600 [Bacteroidota bacterium]